MLTIRSDWAGRIIEGRFALLQWLGGSEWSGTFLTQLEGNPAQKAAIKLTLAASSDAEAHIEARAAALPLSHPHLVQVLHHGRCQIDDTALIYTVTEYADEILSQIIPERPLTADEIRGVLDPVLDTLSYLHGKNLVHAHLKPSNILVIDEQLKLSSDTLHVAGTGGKDIPALTVYDAPEIGRRPISPAADVWSLGITLIETLSQHPPVWDRSSDRDPLIPKSVPQPFADIARACLRFDPARRCELRDITKCLKSGHSIPPSAAKVEKAATSKWRMTGLIAAVFLLLAVVVARQLNSGTDCSSASRCNGEEYSHTSNFARRPSICKSYHPWKGRGNHTGRSR
jgi:Protein kinase domain